MMNNALERDTAALPSRAREYRSRSVEVLLAIRQIDFV